MNHNSANSSLRSFIIFLSITFFVVSGIQSQKKDIKVSDSIQTVDNSISIDNISDESEKLGQRIIKLRKILKPSAKIQSVDSLLKITSVEITNKRDSLLPEINEMTRRVLKVTKVEWKNYRSILKSYQDILNTRSKDISDITDDLIKEIKKWEQTKKKLIENSESTDIYDSLDQAISTLKNILKTAHARLDSIFIIQKGLTELVLSVDQTIAEIDYAELQMQKDYLVFDSKPLWKSQEIENKTIDSIHVKSTRISELFVSGIKENKEQLKEFLSLNMKTFMLQLVFIFLLFMFLIGVGKRWRTDINNLSNPIELQAKIILTHPISATVVLGLLISAFFYDGMIPVFTELHILLVLAGTIFLLPKITTKKFGTFLTLLFLTYLIYTFQAYLGTKTVIVRWISLVNAIILIIALYTGRQIVKKSPSQFEQIYKLFMVISLLYISILAISIFANIIGMFSLSQFLFYGILSSTVLGLVVYLAAIVVTSIFVLFFKLRRSYSIQIDTMVNATNQRIRPLLNWVGFIVWLMFTVKGFDLYEYIVSWINGLMHIHWEVGETTISLGGILAFVSIFIITIILAKLTSTIFQDDWMVNILPRGIGPAISLILRIFFVTIGFYLALSAAGIDLSKLGFIVGALGVGIGFGLQNVVLNFISGLILAFERPINIGDSIEVDQEFGVVTNIGVRSSNIRSYSGYESIIPNGDLISKKVNNYTLTNQNRRSKILMKTAPTADPKKVIALFDRIASESSYTHMDPAPKTYFYGYDPEGSLSFALLYWTSFTDTLKTDSDIALNIFEALKEEGIQAPAPVRHIISRK